MRNRKTQKQPAHTPQQPGKIRAASAAVFLMVVIAAVPMVMLGWRRLDTAQAAGADAAGAAIIPPEGARWTVDLSREDGDHLLEAFFSALDDNGPAAAVGATVSAVPVFVTIYAAGAPAVRACGRGRAIEDGVRSAAADIRTRMPAGAKPDDLRVRIDVLREALPFSDEQRMAFAQRVISEPTGVALQSGGRMYWFLPADFADCLAYANERILIGLCRQAGTDGTRWRSPDLPMWRLDAVGFVNSARGGRYALESPRGLAPLYEPTVARLRRACFLGADYLLRTQQKDGRFVKAYDAVSGLHGGCETVTDQAAVAGALSMLATLRPDPKVADAAYRGLSFAMSATDAKETDPPMAITRRQKVCEIAYELEASAQTLEAICRYRHASGMTGIDPWIAALAEFLLSMQRDEGYFDLAYDVQSGERSSPGTNAGSPVPQAKAALALLLAHGELGQPKYAAAAGRALAALREREAARNTPLRPEEARWLAAALREAAPLLPDRENAEWLGRIAAARRKAQLLPADVPAEDLVGATLDGFPPSARATADDLVVFASACMVDCPDRAENLAAARRAAAWLMHLQYLPENSYYLLDDRMVLGGLREQIGGNSVGLKTLESALRGMALLAGVQFEDMGTNDREG